jgi:ATPase subunit of ABC transporter with duplicated ATPase domains
LVFYFGSDIISGLFHHWILVCFVPLTHIITIHHKQKLSLRTAGQIYIPPGPRLGDVVINVNHLRKSFGDRLLFDDLSFSLPPAGVVGIVGPNGAGT